MTQCSTALCLAVQQCCTAVQHAASQYIMLHRSAAWSVYRATTQCNMLQHSATCGDAVLGATHICDEMGVGVHALAGSRRLGKLKVRHPLARQHGAETKQHASTTLQNSRR